MVNKIKNNKIIKRTLIFISVLVILCSTLALPVLAQAVPDYQPTTSNFYRYITPMYANDFVSYDTSIPIAFIIRGDNTDVNTWRIIFLERFLNVYLSNFPNSYMQSGEFIYRNALVTKQVQTNLSGVWSWDNLYDYKTNNNVDTSFVFINSWDSQFAWAKNETTLKNQYQENYNSTLSNYNALQGDYNTLQNNYTTLYEDYNDLEDAWADLYDDYLNAKDEGYTQALNDYKAFEKGIFAIFNAPFAFVSNIASFEIFGISLIEVVVFILIICLAFVLLKFIGGSIL